MFTSSALLASSVGERIHPQPWTQQANPLSVELPRTTQWQRRQQLKANNEVMPRGNVDMFPLLSTHKTTQRLSSLGADGMNRYGCREHMTEVAHARMEDNYQHPRLGRRERTDTCLNSLEQQEPGTAFIPLSVPIATRRRNVQLHNAS